MRKLINVFTFNSYICLTHGAYNLTLACKGLLNSDRCHVRFATLVDKKRGVHDDIKYTLTNLKIVRLGMARTHRWVKLAPTVPMSLSHRVRLIQVSQPILGYLPNYSWIKTLGTDRIC